MGGAETKLRKVDDKKAIINTVSDHHRAEIRPPSKHKKASTKSV
jgi:hypothetical protein